MFRIISGIDFGGIRKRDCLSIKWNRMKKMSINIGKEELRKFRRVVLVFISE